MINFLKGIVVGVGGIAPGLSGSVLLVIFRLYEKTVNAIGTIFKNFKEKYITVLRCVHCYFIKKHCIFYDLLI